jgi:Lipid A 3-O-deacylase (PagL)
MEKEDRLGGRTWVASLVGIALLLTLPARAEGADELPLCGGCELGIGIGGTYHYWARTGGIVSPFILDWREGRYELGVFRITTSQWIEFAGKPPAYRFASPYWGYSLSRRWRLWANPWLRLYVGVGVSYKTETDALNSTRWNFAEQLALRWDRGRRVPSLELAIRHWSNAGIRLPNRGQDFATLTLLL